MSDEVRENMLLAGYAELFTRIEKALSCADNNDGAHHKQWTIDQMVRALTGDDYDQWVVDYESCGNRDCARHHDGNNGAVDCDSGYGWDTGITP